MQMRSEAEILAISPQLVRVRRGWLAVSKPGSPLRIGVQAESEEEAKRLFREELQAWAALGEASGG